MVLQPVQTSVLSRRGAPGPRKSKRGASSCSNARVSRNTASLDSAHLELKFNAA